LRNNLVQQTIHKREVCSRQRRQMNSRNLGHGSGARIDNHDLRWIFASQPVEYSRPQHGLCLGNVVAEQGNHIGVVDVRIASRLAVAREGLLQRLGCSCGAQSGVAVEVVGSDAAVRDCGEGVVLLEEQLATGVETESAGPVLVEEFSTSVDNEIHRCVPVRFDEIPIDADQWRSQTLTRRISLPTEQILGPEPTVVHPVVDATAHTDDPSVPNRNIHGVAVAV
jgi:hypothetical protein